MSAPVKSNPVKIIRSMGDEPNTTEIITFELEGFGTAYREIFPQQVGEMLNWLTGTQRIRVDFPDPLTKRTPTVSVFRQSLYQLIEDLYPGGLHEFLLAFPYE